MVLALRCGLNLREFLPSGQVRRLLNTCRISGSSSESSRYLIPNLKTPAGGLHRAAAPSRRLSTAATGTGTTIVDSEAMCKLSFRVEPGPTTISHALSPRIRISLRLVRRATTCQVEPLDVMQRSYCELRTGPRTASSTMATPRALLRRARPGAASALPAQAR
jgi:hypothetical protein